MKFICALVGTTAVMTTGTFAMGPEDMGLGHDNELEFKFRGKIEGEARVELEKFTNKLKERHGEFFDFSCAKACFLTPACRFDRHEHWSYCKYDHFPSTCFGLYHVPKHHGHGHREESMAREGEEKSEYGWGHGKKFGRLCYQPSQPGCPEKFPLYCHRHHEKRREQFEGEDFEGDMLV
jgi:hypothetical protein